MLRGWVGRGFRRRHLRVADETPLTNLQLTLLDKVGVPTEQLGDSTGQHADIPDTFAEHARLMFDLQVLAFQTDMTRVITFMSGHVSREVSPRTTSRCGTLAVRQGFGLASQA